MPGRASRHHGFDLPSVSLDNNMDVRQAINAAAVVGATQLLLFVFVIIMHNNNTDDGALPVVRRGQWSLKKTVSKSRDEQIAMMLIIYTR